MEHASADLTLGRVVRPAPRQINGAAEDDAEKMSMTSLRRATSSNTTHAASTVSSKLNIIQLNLQHNKAATAIDNPKDIENELTKVSSAIIQSFEKACPARKIGKRNQVPWWNHELKTLRKKANKAFHVQYRTRKQKDWNKHKEARRAFKRVLRKSKRESWHDFCTNLEKVHESARQIGRASCRERV